LGLLCIASLVPQLSGCDGFQIDFSALRAIMGLPIVTSASPETGPAAGNTEVTIRGANFTSDTGILFGELLPTTLEVINEGVIRATTPMHQAGVVPIVLIQADGAEVVTELSFTYEEPAAAAAPVPLTIESVDPSTGTTEGGSAVTITGTSFVNGMAVLFDLVAASEVNVVNGSLLTATTPAHAESEVDVMLTLPDGRSATAAAAFTYTLDSDGDGLADDQECVGWTIAVDYYGFGTDHPLSLTYFDVASDPFNPDTDDDGLTDYDEFLIGSDPNADDTDRDGLNDAEEINRWWTSPVSVDTDGDANGPTDDLPPNPSLFDGAELKLEPDADPALDATSPTLSDTDGDGRTDYEEFDHPLRSPVISDLPALELELVDEIDIRLDIEYAEEEGTTTEYGTSFMRSTTESRNWHTGGSASVKVGMSATFGVEVEAGFPSNSVTTKAEFGFSVETSYTQDWQVGGESSKTLQDEYSRMEGKSQTHTQTAASGSMSTGVVLTNTGPVSYHLNEQPRHGRAALPAGG
jgi:hypothetical protein